MCVCVCVCVSTDEYSNPDFTLENLVQKWNSDLLAVHTACMWIFFLSNPHSLRPGLEVVLFVTFNSTEHDISTAY